MTLDEFERQVISACIDSPVITSVLVSGSGITWIRLRAYMTDGSFLEAFYNEVTDKTAFALIRADQRIFGADNTGGWHWHPFESPGQHIPDSNVITFQALLKRIEARLSSSEG